MRQTSKYVYHSSKKLPSDKRTKRLPGTGSDQDRYYKCWNCGFVCDKDRDRLNRTQGRSYTVIPDMYLAWESNQFIVDESGDYILLEQGSTDVPAGCPLCGCTNYR